MKRVLPILLVLVTAQVLTAGEPGFVSLFNGRDLGGWVNVNCAPETWSVSNGVIHCTGYPTGALRTSRQYENFVLELEWRHLRSGGNSGVFIWSTPIAAPGVPFLRGIEVQVLDHGFNIPGKNEWYTTHGDVFPIHGATMKPFGRHNGMRSFPSEERSKGTPEWNQYRVSCTNGVLRLSVNGKEVSGGKDCQYRKGYLGLESEGAPVEFRNIRIQELPGSGAPAEWSAPADHGWRSLFTGLDLRGWQTNATTAARWRVEGEHLKLLSGTPSTAGALWTESEFGDADFIIDCKTERPGTPKMLLRTAAGKSLEVNLEGGIPGRYQRFVLSVSGRALSLKTDGKETQHLALPADATPRRALGLCDTGEATEFMNLYVGSAAPAR